MRNKWSRQYRPNSMFNSQLRKHNSFYCFQHNSDTTLHNIQHNECFALFQICQFVMAFSTEFNVFLWGGERGTCFRPPFFRGPSRCFVCKFSSFLMKSSLSAHLIYPKQIISKDAVFTGGLKATAMCKYSAF